MDQLIEFDLADRRKREGRRRPLVVALLICLALIVPVAQAQEAPTPTLDQIQTVARELYCPLCNGVRLDNCELQACVQMRQVIAERLTAGASKEQIKQEFVAQYGPIVLGEPPREGLNWLIWALPVVALIAGAIWLLWTLRGWTKAQTAAPAAASAADQSASGRAAGQAEYLAQVDADLAGLEELD
ncbi:MAG TPA: cytochrome c-type biogenesis protein CcmH [Anaerolineae bacterium]|nr:cytochrome c-type biogenesis protein CcmH [Anaerolineae bacterium]